MQDQTTNIVAIVGVGNMGSGLARGMLAQGWNPGDIFLVDNSNEKITLLQKEFPNCNVISIDDAQLEKAQAFILAVKPIDLQNTCEQLKQYSLHENTVFISIAAGVKIESLQKWLPPSAIVYRCMPNTPAAIGLGITGIYTPNNAHQANNNLVDKLLSGSGKTIWVSSETMLDAVTALSGSGPAYLFYFMECLQSAGQNLGLSEQESYQLTLQTVFGAASLAQSTSSNFSDLREAVTSKGGTTEQALQHFMQAEFSRIVNDAIKAAAVRAKEISDSF